MATTNAAIPHSLPTDFKFELHAVTPSNAQHTLPAMLRLIKALALFERAPEQVEATEELLRRSLFGDENGEHKYAECVLVYVGGGPGKGKAIGMACYYFTFSTWTGRGGLYLEDLYVDDEYRGRGIAKLLFSYLGDICAERQLPRMEWVVLKWNEGARQVYKKMGAEDLDEWVTCRLTGESLKALAKAK
ncbi:GNAT family N-acetyltransferase [Rhodotorula paludigena]|uniref:GNAT family N-acetyltransferase n=1 Tax=Rhodotorula paludigena TaxID=86838 RepID=UPI003173DD7F